MNRRYLCSVDGMYLRQGGNNKGMAMRYEVRIIGYDCKKRKKKEENWEDSKKIIEKQGK